MLKFLTSLSFLYLLAIASLLVDGYFYRRQFNLSRSQGSRFPFIFLLISVCCIGFLWINVHAPLRLKTFSNLDHHFIRHDGFEVTRSITLGQADTVNFDNNAFNRFSFSRKNGNVIISSDYSEEPFYQQHEAGYKIISVNYPAIGHQLNFQLGRLHAGLRANTENEFELTIGNSIFKKRLPIKKGISCWSLFKDDEQFINSDYYNLEHINTTLAAIFLLRDDVSRKNGGELKYFISGKLFSHARSLKYDEVSLEPGKLAFEYVLKDRSQVAWGIGFLINNRNQFEIRCGASDSFFIFNRYPTAYPLTGEHRHDWTKHGVNKFLVADGADMHNISGVFREGFLFPAFNQGVKNNFSPVLLDYQKNSSNAPIQLKATYLSTSKNVEIKDNKILLPAASGGFNWSFSIRNTFDWDFGSRSMTAGNWQWMMFGSLAFFVVLVFFTAFTRRQGWVWQLLSCITIVLLTTRFFLYWRYKSFPPFEGMDLPSQQQLQSFSNFGIIVFATILLALFFGFGIIRTVFKRPVALAFRSKSKMVSPMLSGAAFLQWHRQVINRSPAFIRQLSSRAWFFIAWGGLLFAGATIAALNNFEAVVCRRLAIGLTIAWFIFLFISYKYSPLTQSAERSWWRISTGNFLSMVISNPVKIILSVSLLALFAFIDIGFAIVFLNFLFFNEAFLCINYGIAGLSAGSKRNAGYFGVLGFIYLMFFVLNLFFAPYVFKALLGMSNLLYLVGYALFAIGMACIIVRILPAYQPGRRLLTGGGIALALFAIAFFFFPKERILDKAAMTKYRIDVLTTPVDQSIIAAYSEGKNFVPVIRAAQNQWFINTFIYEENNPGVQSAGFNLLPHAPQNKGARYNAQATDLVTSRFMVAEHGKWSVLLFAVLLLLPGIMLAYFYKLYPDFTNRTNQHYPNITIGFSILNYLLITALLVILAATGRYIFFGQDLPFASILSKQSILFPCILVLAVVLLFKNIPQAQYSNSKKVIPGSMVFVFLLLLLFLFKPSFNKNKEFGVDNLAKQMETYVQLRLQPIMDHIDTAVNTKRLTLAKKDQAFCDSLRKMLAAGFMDEENGFFTTEINAYARSGITRHLDQRHMLYLDLYAGRPQLAINENYFRVEPPPHLQQLWTGNVFGDTSVFNISIWNPGNGSITAKRITAPEQVSSSEAGIPEELVFMRDIHGTQQLNYVNKHGIGVHVKYNGEPVVLEPGAKLPLANPSRLSIVDPVLGEMVLNVQPDAFMENYYVNGSRYYLYPLKSRFIWARNFAESIASEYTAPADIGRHAYVSLDYELMDSLSAKIARMMATDTSYYRGAEYGICIADGNGRLIAMTDHVKGLLRPDPNDKSAFNKVIQGENGYVSQSRLRKQIGNINLLRLNPGPGSTFKPIVFSAIASQLDWNWDGFSAEGFAEKQNYFGGEKVPEYDFEKNNGRISTVSDYLKYSDNYYHSNVLLLGSYPKQDPARMLSQHFMDKKPGSGLHWPYFSYTGKQYWLNGFQNWPGYSNGRANFGSDSSFTTIGLLNNFNIYTHPVSKSFDMHFSAYDSALFRNAYRRSGFILPEYSLFDQFGDHIDHRIPYDLFTSCFRGHVKGSSQVLVSPAKMVEAFGRLISQSRNYNLTFDPYAQPAPFIALDIDKNIPYNSYLDVMREKVFYGMREALYAGTAARLGAMLKKETTYYYYAKTGTTGDDDVKTKSKLLAFIISEKDLADPGFNFRNNKFYTIYFTSQNGPAKQNEEFQAELIKYFQETTAFKQYMNEN